MLCEKCSNIHFRRLQKCGLPAHCLPEDYRDSSHDRGSSVYYFHHENRWVLEASADEGCHFCEMIRECLFASSAWRKGSIGSFAGKQIILRRTWLDEWIEEEGSDALECSEELWVYCEDRYVVSSTKLAFSSQYQSRPESTKLTRYRAN
jgi:hypothetical protein